MEQHQEEDEVNEYEEEQKRNKARLNSLLEELKIKQAVQRLMRTEPTKERKKRTNEWTNEEVQVLEEGVRRHGAGAWSKILKDVELGPKLRNRTNVSLKDKYRLLQKIKKVKLV
jgi:hypothetical protein